MSTESQFLPGIPPTTLLAWLEQVDPGRFSPQKTGRPYQRLRDLDQEAAAILQQIRAGNMEQRARLCQIGQERQLLRRDLLAMLALHMALIRREMKGPQASQYDQALARSSKVLGEGGKIFEFMDQGTLQKVFEQAGDLIQFEQVLRSQAGRRLEEWAPAARLKALKLGLDTLTRYLPLPKGTDQFFKFYSEAIGAIADGIAPIEKRVREQRLALIDYEGFQRHPEAWQTLEQWQNWIAQRKEPGIAEDAVKMAWIGTYLDRNKALASDLIRDEIGKQIVQWCPPPTPLEQLEEASRVRGEKEPLPGWGWKAPGEIEREWEEWQRGAEPPRGATPKEIAQANREAELEKQCAALKEEARAAQSRCDEKRTQVQAAEEKARRENAQRTAAFDKDRAQIAEDYHQASQEIRKKYDAVQEQERQVRQMEMELARLRTGASVAIAVGEADQEIEARYAREEAEADQAYQAAAERWKQGLGTKAGYENAFARLEDVWARKKQDQQALKAKEAELQRQLEARCAQLEEQIASIEAEIRSQRAQELKELEAAQEKRDRRLRELQARQKEEASAEEELPRLRTEAEKACQEAQRALEEQKRVCDEWQRAHADCETHRAHQCVEERLGYQVPQVMRMLESLLVGEREIERLLKDTRGTIRLVEGLAQTSPQDREKEAEDIEELEGRRWSIVRQCFTISHFLDLIHFTETHRTGRIGQDKALSGESRFLPFLDEETMAARSFDYAQDTPATRQEAIAALRRDMALLEDGLQRMRRCREELERQFAPLVDELTACIAKSGRDPSLRSGPRRARWRKQIAQLQEDSRRFEGETGDRIKKPLQKLAIREPAKRGLGEGGKWAIGALIVVLALCCACLVGSGAIFGGWKAWERIRSPEPAEKVALATITPAPQQVEQEAERQTTRIVEVVPTIHTPSPTPGQEEVVPPTYTPTPTRTPTITPTPTEALPSGPEERVFVAEDGQELVGTYYPPPACPSPLTILYFPWVRGDKDDWQAVAALLPDDLAYGALTITPRGCAGGCQEWTPSAWLRDYLAAIEAARALPCAGQSPLIVIGSSVGADGAIVACAREARCVGAIAFSPGGHIDEITYADEVTAAVERGKRIWSVVGEDDPESARLDRPGLGDSYREIVVPGSDHGNQLYDERTARVVQDFVECATNAFASPRCLEVLAENHLDRGNGALAHVREHYQEECERWIPEARRAVRECTTAIELNPDSAAAYFCRALGRTYLEEPAGAIEDLERALERGLTGKEQEDAETLLGGLKEQVAAPPCSIGPIRFTEGWTRSGEPLNPSETCSGEITDELRTNWELRGPCDQRFMVKWSYNGALACQHPYEPWEHERWEGSIHYEEEGQKLASGTWTVSVFVGSQEIGSASCNIPWPEVEPPIPATLFLAFNAAQPPFDAPGVRRALAMAIDREALLDLLGREDKLPARGLVPPSLWADERYYGQADVPFDPKRALALLGMVGGHEHYDLWDIDLELTLLAPESSLEVARFIQAQWQEHLGLEVELTAVENGAYADRVDTLSPHAFLWLWYADYTSPYNFLGDGVGDIARRIQWSNLEFDQLVEEAFQEANQERRMALYSQAERILCETDVAIAPLYHYIYASP